MIYIGTMEGKYVSLCSVDEDDAIFTLRLRQDERLTKYIPKLEINLEQQVEWIKKQRQKEGDYFFCVRDKSGNRIGTTSIYNIEENHAEAGRIVMLGDGFQSFEAQYLTFKFAFYDLHLDYLVNYIYANNKKALRFNRKFGGRRIDTIINSKGIEEMVTINTLESFEQSKDWIYANVYDVM